MVSKEKIFHYDIYEDNGIDGTRFFGVKLSIDGNCKSQSYQKKKAEEKASQRTYFALQEKWTRNNIIFIKIHFVHKLTKSLHFLLSNFIRNIFTSLFLINMAIHKLDLANLTK
jgi:hypothetical protein